MPKIKKHHIYFTARTSGKTDIGEGAGRTLSEDVDIYVNSQGEFSCKIPERFIEEFEEIKIPMVKRAKRLLFYSNDFRQIRRGNP